MEQEEKSNKPKNDVIFKNLFSKVGDGEYGNSAKQISRKSTKRI